MLARPERRPQIEDTLYRVPLQQVEPSCSGLMPRYYSFALVLLSPFLNRGYQLLILKVFLHLLFDTNTFILVHTLMTIIAHWVAFSPAIGHAPAAPGSVAFALKHYRLYYVKSQHGTPSH